MSTLTVFEVAQLEAEESVWVPARATRFISRLLSQRLKKLATGSTMERHRHRRQPRPSAVRMITQLRSTSRRRYTASDSATSSTTAPIKRTPKLRRAATANAKLAPNR